MNKSLFIVIATILFTGCKKFVDIDPPRTMIETSVVFSSESAALSAVAGVYSRCQSPTLGLLTGGIPVYSGLGSDEISNTAPNGTYDAFRTNSVLPNTTSYAVLWSNTYNLIFHTNSILQGLEVSGALPAALKDQLKGEMLVMRSLLYFYLLNLFGDVPYQVSTDYRVNAIMPRTPTGDIYKELEKDLERADTLLKATYPSTYRLRPNKYTAKALLARVYLYNGNYSKAESISTAIINSGIYSLATIAAVFNSTTSNETIWAIVRDNGNTQEAFYFTLVTPTTRPIFQLTPQLFAAFETNDQRRVLTANGWVGKNTVSGVDYYYPNKYKQRTPTGVVIPTEYLVMFRLAEQYLIRAEARVKLNNLVGAIQDINSIRVRAGLPSLPLSLTAPQVMTALKQERRIELFSEWGHRWFDLKRWGDATTVLAPIKGASWQTTDELYPIPVNEIFYNPFLVQNPGY
jgi:hypothetical protein